MWTKIGLSWSTPGPNAKKNFSIEPQRFEEFRLFVKSKKSQDLLSRSDCLIFSIEWLSYSESFLIGPDPVVNNFWKKMYPRL